MTAQSVDRRTRGRRLARDWWKSQENRLTSGATRATVPHMKVGLLIAAVLAGVAAWGCGGGSPGEKCGVAPCGGDVVGSWTATSSCIDRATLEKDILTGLKGNCPTVSLDEVTMTPRGTLSMNADMTFTGALDVDATFAIVYPAACITNQSCAIVEQTLQSTVGTNGITAVSCVSNTVPAGSCTCTTELTLDVINTSGTYATSGTMLTFAEAPGGNGPYCVQGSSLHLVGYDSATMTRIISDLVMTRQ